MPARKPTEGFALLQGFTNGTQGWNLIGAMESISSSSLEPPADHDPRLTPGSRSGASAVTCDVTLARARVHAHCGVYTLPAVVGMMLDLVGWTIDADLTNARLLEPACGDGIFVAEAARRLIRSLGPVRSTAARISDTILAFEFDIETARRARASVAGVLLAEGVAFTDASRLAETWIRTADFLTASIEGDFSHVVGNPPYMRWSLVPNVLRETYRKMLPAHVAKGDLCLGFVWRGLQLLRSESGAMAFLCADRWLRCAYGTGVRETLVSTHTLVAHVEVHDAPVFAGNRDVGAYAGISLLRRRPVGTTFFARADSAKALRAALAKARAHDSAPGTPSPTKSAVVPGIALVEPELAHALALLRTGGLPLVRAGIQVRCGMALGAAKVFVVAPDADIEPQRLTPLVRSSDVLEDGSVTSTKAVLNVWTADGELVDLNAHPRLAVHLEAHRKLLSGRACVSQPGQWYRSIDKIDAGRLTEPKLLVVGMAKTARLGMDPGGRQHGNALYALTSSSWPLTALQRLLDAGVLELFGVALSPRFSGGTKRFDGHVLSQVYVPPWQSVHPAARSALLDLTTMIDAEVVATAYMLAGRPARRSLRVALSHCAAAGRTDPLQEGAI